MVRAFLRRLHYERSRGRKMSVQKLIRITVVHDVLVCPNDRELLDLVISETLEDLEQSAPGVRFYCIEESADTENEESVSEWILNRRDELSEDKVEKNG